MNNWILALIILALAVVGAPLFSVLFAFAMMGVATVGSNLNPVGSPIERMFVGAMTDIWKLASAEESITLSTIPLFTFAGYIMAEAKTANRLVRVANGLFGWVPGGLAIVTVAACAFFTTFTGASGVTIVAIGGLIFPTLLKGGYKDRFALGLMTGSGSIGLLFPPSLPIVVYGMVYGLTAGSMSGVKGLKQLDIGRFLVAGIIPGIVVVGIISAYCAYIGVTQKVPRVKFNGRDALRALWEAKWELPIPFFLLYVIATMTMQIPDTAAFTVVYVIIVECFIYKDVKLSKLIPVARESMTLVGAIFGILVASQALTSYFGSAEIPQALNSYLARYVHSKYTFLLALNIVLLIVGSMKDIFSAILVMVPLMVLPAATYHVDPYHLGVIFLVNLEIGYLMPPIGLNLVIAAFRFNRPMTDVYRAALPFIGLMFLSLAIVTYVPQLTEWSLKLGPKAAKQIDMSEEATPVTPSGDGGLPAGWDILGAPLNHDVCAKGVQAQDRLMCENAVNERPKCEAMTDADEKKDCLAGLAREFGDDTEFRYYPFPKDKSWCASMSGQDRLNCEIYVDEAAKCAGVTDPDEKETCLQQPNDSYLEALGLKEAEDTEEEPESTDDSASTGADGGT